MVLKKEFILENMNVKISYLEAPYMRVFNTS